MISPLEEDSGNERKLLSTKQVADMLGVSTRKVRQLVHSGSLRAYRLNARLFRFDATEVMESLNSNFRSDAKAVDQESTQNKHTPHQ